MASIYRRGYAVKRADGSQVRRKCKVYTVKWRDAAGIEHTVRGYTDREASRQLGARLERESAQGAEGLVDLYAKEKRRALTEHVAEYIADLETRGRKESYLYRIEKRFPKLWTGCGWRTLGDICAEPMRFLSWRTEQKGTLAEKTLNDYLEALQSFLGWCVKARRIAANPCASIQYIDMAGVTRKRRRRALTLEEFEALIHAAPERRQLLYKVAFYCGLRRGDLKALTWADVELDRLPAYLITHAQTSKGKRDTRHVLKPELAAEIRTARPKGARLMDRVFPSVPRMCYLWADFKAAGIPKTDELGRTIDLHATGRNTPNTMMANKGTPLQIRMDFMRHTDSRLTLGTYTDANLLDKAQAMDALPWVGNGRPLPKPDEAQRACKTGTYDAKPLNHPLNQTLHQTADFEGCSLISPDTPTAQNSAPSPACNSSVSKPIDSACTTPDSAGYRDVNQRELQPTVGIEPTTCALRKHRSTTELSRRQFASGANRGTKTTRGAPF